MIVKKIAIFASGSGSNAEKIMEHFSESSLARVEMLLSNNPQAYALERARRFGIQTVVFNREQFTSGEVAAALRARAIDFIVLAGFLWLVPPALVEEFRGRIVNIHPALLPKYGGKGMYGDRVHRAVIEAGEKESGITIHLVNEVYDSGDIIVQYKVDVAPGDTPEMLAAKIHKLEHCYFPQVIEDKINKL